MGRGDTNSKEEWSGGIGLGSGVVTNRGTVNEYNYGLGMKRLTDGQTGQRRLQVAS